MKEINLLRQIYQTEEALTQRWGVSLIFNFWLENNTLIYQTWTATGKKVCQRRILAEFIYAITFYVTWCKNDEGNLPLSC